MFKLVIFTKQKIQYFQSLSRKLSIHNQKYCLRSGSNGQTNKQAQKGLKLAKKIYKLKNSNNDR